MLARVADPDPARVADPDPARVADPDPARVADFCSPDPDLYFQQTGFGSDKRLIEV